ncbi:hypothetical protein Tco_0884691, partial [Tanacetum coccineum]
TPQQNGVVKRRNRTLIEAARTILLFSKAPIEDLGKLKATSDIGIFVGYAPNRKVLVVLAATPSSTTIDQDAPLTSHSPSSAEVQPLISHQGVVAGPTIEDNPFACVEDYPFVNAFAPEPSSDESSSG